MNVLRIQVSIVDIATRYGVDDTGFESRQAQGNFSSPKIQNVSGAHPASYSVGTRALSTLKKRLFHEVYQSLPYSAEVKE